MVYGINTQIDISIQMLITICHKLILKIKL